MANEQAPAAAGRYVEANGLRIAYEEHGSGPPLVLIHGGMVTSASWERNLPALAAHYRVITPDSRGHGRTANPDGALSYRQMADDTAAFIRALGLERPAVGGYSDGGQIALELGMRHPALAGALIIGAAWFEFSAQYLSFVGAMGFERPGEIDTARFEQTMGDFQAIIQALHEPLGGPDYWRELARQLSTPWLTPLDYTPEDFARVTAPALVLVGDRDEGIPIEEAVRLYRHLPAGELAVVPGATHFFPFERPVLFETPLLDFLGRHLGQPAG